MWNFLEDHTPAVITAQRHIESAHANEKLSLPQTAVLFYMHGGEAFVRKNYKTRLISKRFPRFLASCPVYRLRHHSLCFLDGGRGAPQAVDTLETLAALGVQNVICVGMCGVFAGGLTCGDILIPSKAFVEEGTSLHYFPSITFSQPDQCCTKRHCRPFLVQRICRSFQRMPYTGKRFLKKISGAGKVRPA